MGCTLKKKEFAPLGSKFFSFEVDPFQKDDNNFDRVTAPESVSIPFNNILFLAQIP